MAELLSDAQIEECKKAFVEYDKDGDGTINTKELRIVMKAMGQHPTEEELQQMMDEVDEDKSGSIEFPEFLKLMAKQLGTEDEDVLIEAWNVLDVENSGIVKVEELRELMTTLGDKFTIEEFDDMLLEANIDGDEITYQQFSSVML